MSWNPNFRSRYPSITVVVFLLLILLTVVIDAYLFELLLGGDFFAWYRDTGPYMALTIAIVGASWNKFDENCGLISGDPFEYIGSWFQVVGLSVYSFGSHLRRASHERSIPFWDSLFVLPMTVIFLAALILYLLFVVPFQYFVFLVCGAPARIAQRSSVTVGAHLGSAKEHYALDFDQFETPDKVPEGWWDASFRDRPLVLTGAFSAAGLATVAMIWDQLSA